MKEVDVKQTPDVSGGTLHPNPLDDPLVTEPPIAPPFDPWTDPTTTDRHN